MESGGVFKAAESDGTWAPTELFTNGDLSTATDASWEFSVPFEDGAPYYFGIHENQLNAYNKYDGGSEQTVSATKTIENVPAGTYRLKFGQTGIDMGEAASPVFAFDIKDGAGKVLAASKKVDATTGWSNDLSDVVSDEFTITDKTATVKITISGTLPLMKKEKDDGYWANFDDFVLEQKSDSQSGSGEEEEQKGYSISVTPSITDAVAGQKVTLTAVLKKDGQEITDLEKEGLRLWWYSDEKNEAGKGKSPKGLTVDSDKGGYRLSADVTAEVAGTYYVAVKLQDENELDENQQWKTLLLTAVPFTAGDAPVPDPVQGDIDVQYVPNLSSDFALGWDISSLIVEKNSGVKYYDFAGNELKTYADFCKFAASQGITHVRVRVWNDPWDADGNGYGGGNNDVDTAVEIAKACKEAGIKLLVDFHGSDFWADPERQLTPKAWEGYTVDQKAVALAAFLKDSLTKIAATGVTIDMVQVGNETNNGFVGESKTEDMLKLFGAGADAVHNFDPNIKVLIHFTDPQKGTLSTWAERLNGAKVDYDVLATSYYPQYHGSRADLTQALKDAKAAAGDGKDVLVVETSYPYTTVDSDDTGDDGNGHLNIGGADYKWPFTVQGQANYMREVIDAANKGGSIGLFYWEPAWITVGDTTGLTGDALQQQKAENQVIWNKFGSGWASKYAGEYDKNARDWWGSSAMDNSAFFDTKGHPLASLKVWSAVRTGMTTGKVRVEAIGSAEATVTKNQKPVLPETVSVTYNTGIFDEKVTWDLASLNTQNVGTVTAHGTVTFSQTVNDGTYAGKKTADVTAQIVVIEENLIKDADDAGLEKGDNFEIGGKGFSSIPNGEDPYEGKGSIHWWISGDDPANAGFATYKVPITLQPGSYVFESIAQGYGGDKVVMNILDENNKVLFTGEPGVLTGYAEWITPKVEFQLAKTTTVKLQVLVNIQSGGWGSVDNLYLHIASGSEPGGETPDVTEPSVGTRPVEDVKEEIKSGTGKTVTVDMVKADGSVDTKVPKDVLSELKGKNVNLELKMDGYSWVINGRDVTADSLKDVDLKVVFNTTAVPSSAIAKITDGKDYQQLHLESSGDFGFKAALKLQADKKYAGKYGNLFYYNDKKELKFMNAGKVSADGSLSLTFTHASDYVIIYGENLTAKYGTSPDTGDVGLSFYLFLLAAGFAAAGLAFRRKNALR